MVWYWHENRHIDQQNRIKSPEISPCLYGQLIFDKGGTSIQWSNNSLFNKWCQENWTGTRKNKKQKTQTTILHHTPEYGVWIIDLNISHKTINVLAENRGRKITDILHSNIFASLSPKAGEIMEKINKWDYIKLNSFCTAKESIIRIKREPTIWENIFANDTLDEGLISKIYKGLI